MFRRPGPEPVREPPPEQGLEQALAQAQARPPTPRARVPDRAPVRGPSLPIATGSLMPCSAAFCTGRGKRQQVAQQIERTTASRCLRIVTPAGQRQDVPDDSGPRYDVENAANGGATALQYRHRQLDAMLGGLLHHIGRQQRQSGRVLGDFGENALDVYVVPRSRIPYIWSGSLVGDRSCQGPVIPTGMGIPAKTSLPP